MGYYPIALDLTAKKCLVVGGGQVALRKVRSLLDAGAEVTIISPDVISELEALDNMEIIRREFRLGDTKGYAVVFAATGDRSVNIDVSREAQEKGIPVNVVDDPELCNFIVPAVVRRGDLVLSVSTSGKSPALSKRIRKELEAAYGPEYAEYLNLLGEMREIVKAKYTEQRKREEVFNRILESGILELVREGKLKEARTRAEECI